MVGRNHRDKFLAFCFTMVVIAPHVQAGGIGISWFRTCVRKVAVCNPLSISELLKLLAAKREQGVLVNCCELMCYVPPHPSGNWVPVGGGGYLMRFRNSLRVRSSLRKMPLKADVVVTALAFCTPRRVMQVCEASITTATPSGFSVS